MFRRLRQKLLMSVIIIGLIFSSIVAYAGSITYTYDGLNRLIRAEYEDGTIIQYIYDQYRNLGAIVITNWHQSHDCDNRRSPMGISQSIIKVENRLRQDELF